MTFQSIRFEEPRPGLGLITLNRPKGGRGRGRADRPHQPPRPGGRSHGRGHGNGRCHAKKERRGASPDQGDAQSKPERPLPGGRLGIGEPQPEHLLRHA
jgi:hypothetical protein